MAEAARAPDGDAGGVRRAGSAGMGGAPRLARRALAVCLVLGGCGASPPVLHRAQFPPELMREAEAVVQEVADSRGLRRYPTFGPFGRGLVRGFSLEFFVPGGARILAGGPYILRGSVLDVDNGVMTSLTVRANEGPGLSAPEAERLAMEVRGALESRLSLTFCEGRVERHLGYCEAWPVPRLLYRASADPFRHAADREWRELLRTALGGAATAVGTPGYWVSDRHAGHQLSDRRDGDFQFLAAYDERAMRRGEHALALANRAPDGSLTLAAYDQGGMPPAEADALVAAAKRVLAERFGVSLCRADPATGVCDERHGRMEREREAWASARETRRIEDVEAFLAERPRSPYAAEARGRLARLRALAAPTPPAPPGEAVRWRGRQPGERFADPLDGGGLGPELVVVPGGAFRMGCVSGVACRESELPVREVRIPRPFAIARRETTYAEYRRFAKRDPPAHERWSGHPAVHLTWSEASAYAAWLSARAGERYRLPTEAEWERAARAGLETAFPWGDGLRLEEGVDAGEVRTARCRQCPGEWGYLSWTVPVAWYPANGWGLYDTAGNAAEWTADCWQEDHLGAPADGGARTVGDCARRAVRGGSHAQAAMWSRSAARAGRLAEDRYVDVGFRVLRELRNGE